MRYNFDLGFKEGDMVYKITSMKIDKSKCFKVHKLGEVEEGGNHYDGHEEKHYAYLEDMETNITEKWQIAFINLMYKIKDIYFVKCEKKEETISEETISEEPISETQ
jgi:hypothetical protein